MKSSAGRPPDTSAPLGGGAAGGTSPQAAQDEASENASRSICQAHTLPSQRGAGRVLREDDSNLGRSLEGSKRGLQSHRSLYHETF